MADGIADTPDAAVIEEMAREAIRRLPAMFRDFVSEIVLRVEELPDSEALASVGLDDPWELVGLYEGRPVGERSIWSSGEMPGTIFLFRRPLLAEWRQNGGSLEELVTHVVVHEVGHHFGFSDEEMEAIENDES